MNLVWLHPRDGDAYRAVHAFVEARTGPVESGTTLAVVRGGKLAGAVLFGGYRPERGVVEISAAADDPKWLTRTVMREAFGYAFDQLKCQAVALRADVTNDRVQHLAAGLGFNRYEIPRLRGKDKPEAIYILGDDDWHNSRFNGGRHV